MDTNTDLMKQMLLNAKLFLMKHDFVQITKTKDGTSWRRKTDGMIIILSQRPDGSLSISLDDTKTKGKTALNKAARSSKIKTLSELRDFATFRRE